MSPDQMGADLRRFNDPYETHEIGAGPVECSPSTTVVGR